MRLNRRDSDPARRAYWEGFAQGRAGGTSGCPYLVSPSGLLAEVNRMWEEGYRDGRKWWKRISKEEANEGERR